MDANGKVQFVTPSNGLASSSEDLMARARKARRTRLMQRSMAVGAMTLAGGHAFSCAQNEGTASSDQTEVVVPNVPRPGADNSGGNYEGERRPDMVFYAGEHWIEHSNCNTRAGCMDVDFILKVFVKPVASANLDTKKIGVLFRVPGWEPGRSEMALGSYFTTNDGIEEWHVRIRLHPWSASPMALLFNAFYRDGTGRTYYDDNEGEFHVAARDPYGILRQQWCCDDEATQLVVDGQGVTGQIAVMLSDLAYDKQVELIWTADGWATVQSFGMGGAAANEWRWVRDDYLGYELWRLPVAIARPNVAAFEYAVVYRHGVVNGAKSYEFWDNNGGTNYVVGP